jgi:hypothetical protein
MGIRDKPIAPGSPWQNGYAERLIGTIRRECIDHLIVFGEAHQLHSRWRHFVVAGEDRWALIDKATNWRDPSARARAAFDLAIVSVLLDAGAGPQWRYSTSATRESIGRSEGLARASIDMFCRGTFSSDPGNRLQADAQGLMQLSDDFLANGFQVSSSNPLVGIGGRTDLLRRLGAVVAAGPEIFGREDKARPGGLFDHFAALLESRVIPAAESYGIHGTPEPQNVSKTESHGCIRLTNWDALALSHLVGRGTPVNFIN